VNPKILVIDDDPDTIASYHDILDEHGFELSSARSRQEALTQLQNGGPWDVVLLDEKLSGPGGPASATALLLDIAGRAPEARTIVITGFATPQLVQTALQAGAWEYLEKDHQFLPLLLPLRVRHAVEAARERRISRMGRAEIEGELRRTWAEAQRSEQPAARRGRLLEETVCLLFRTMPGLEDARVNTRAPAEEFDVVAQNASQDEILRKEGPILLVECKNWSGTVTPVEYEYFRAKLRDRFQRATLGILLGMNGFTEGVDTKGARRSNERELILTLDRRDLDGWIDAPDRVAWLRERLFRAMLRT
jgi:CheY-like chemotaxis protein